MPNKKSSSLKMWLEQIKLWPFRFFLITLTTLLMIPFSLLFIVLFNYFIRSINAAPSDVSWTKLFGSQIADIISPFVTGTQFQYGFTIAFQKEWFVISFVVVSFLSGFFNYISESMLRDYGELMARKYRTDISKKYLSLTFESANKIDAGLLASIIGEDMREAQQSFTRLINSLMKDGLCSLVFVAWLILLDWHLFVLLLSMFIPTAIVVRLTSKTLKRLSRQGLQFESELLSGLLERMRGWQTIQIYKAIPFEIKNFDKINSKIYHVWRRATRAKTLSTPLVEWLGVLAFSLVIILALRRVADGHLSSQVFSGFIVTVGFLSDKINRISTQLGTTRKGTDALHRIRNFLNMNYEKRSDEKTKAIASFHLEKIELQDLTIRLENGNILAQNINLNLEKGSMVAIIGPSGVGKSTLIRSILGVQKTYTGSILFNNNITNDKFYKEIASWIGFIPQEPFLFSGSIFENVVYPEKMNPQHPETQNEVKKALKLANLEMDLFDNIQGLSGGEKQRLMFARLFFHKPQFIVIDEGTSALDNSNELFLLENLKNISQNSISFIVAHRPLVKTYATHILDLSEFKPQLTT